MEQFLRQYRAGLFVLALLALLAGTGVIIVGEDRQAVIKRMGEPHRVINRFVPGDTSGAGLAVMIPLAEQVVWLPRGLVPFSHAGKRLRSADQQWLLVDTDVTYVTGGDVSRFQRSTVPPKNQPGGQQQSAPSAAPAPARSGGSDGNAAPVYRGPSVRVTRGKETEETAVSAKANGTAILSSQSSGVRRAGQRLPAAGATVIN